MIAQRWVETAYCARLRRQVVRGCVPGHVGLIMDGNRRWARQAGFPDPSIGHRYGADHLQRVLEWCDRVGVREVTAYVVSADNLRRRSEHEVSALLDLIEQVLPRVLNASDSPWSLRVAGSLDIIPASTAAVLKECVDITAGRTRRVTLGIGYDPRADITEAVRSFLHDAAEEDMDIRDVANALTIDDLASHFATSQSPDIELVIRTSGEQRVSGFFPWQSTRAQIYICDLYWPGFREIDFLRALRDYAARHR